MNKNKYFFLGFLLVFLSFSLDAPVASAAASPKYTDAMCRSLGGSYAGSADACTEQGTNYSVLGDFINGTTGEVTGVCCGPTGLSDAQCVTRGGTCQVFDPGSVCGVADQIRIDKCTDKSSGAEPRNCCAPKPKDTTSSLNISGLNYQLLEKIPGTSGLGSDLPGYVSAIYKVALIVVTLSAVLMLSVGGFMYLTSAGNTSSISSAKTVITDALIGLVIALSAWLVLFIINPDLVKVSLGTLPPVSGGQTYVTTPTDPTTPSGSFTHAQATAALSAAGISVTSSGNCSDINNKTCTSLDGIPQSTITNIIKLKSACGCSFNVTGGTEVGHASHGTGRPIVDVSESPALNTYLKNGQASLTSKDGITKICASKTYISTAYNCGGFVESAPHFHIQFKP